MNHIKRYTAEKLKKIFSSIAPQTGLLVPLVGGELPVARPVGPAVGIYWLYSEIFPGTGNIENRYWDMLRRAPVMNGVGVLAFINSLLAEHQSVKAEVHKVLNERLLGTDLLAKVTSPHVVGNVSAVFNRLGCLQLMRHLLLFGRPSITSAERNERELGEMLLLSNDFLPAAPIQNALQPATLDLVLSFLPVWDVHNPRDLAYALSRMYTILAEILPGDDAEVRRLAAKAGLNAAQITVGSLSLNDFIATVFGLFAFGRQRRAPEFVTFDVSEVFSKVGFPPGILKKLVRDRALTAVALKRRLRNGKRSTRKEFGEELRKRALLTESLKIFRQYPLMKLNATRVLILDLEFLAELLTSGVYWAIFDSLPSAKRETFRELWGRLFEIYAVRLLTEFYPPRSQILVADLQYSGGQIDALLDFGNAVVVFEIKSSLLREDAKRSGKASQFVPDYERKFVRNARGAPKALLQLAASCKAIEDGKISTAIKPGRIYPVCISDEPAVESFFFTTYSNEIFEKELPRGSRIQPVTMMSVNELEEVLPYVSGNSFSWDEVLDFRSRGPTGGAFSVHQAIYDLLRARSLPSSRNQAIRKSFDEVWRIVGSRYKPPGG